MLICKYCGDVFKNNSLKANHIRWKHQTDEHMNKYIINSKIIKENEFLRKFGELKDFEVSCKNCKTIFKVKEREFLFPKKEVYFCSVSCANTREHSNETISKISDGIKIAWQDGRCSSPILNINNENRFFNSKGELEVSRYFKDNFQNDNWTSGGCVLYNGKRFSRDLFSDKIKVCIEYDGIYHVENIRGQLEDVKIKDLLFEEWCLINDFRLIRISENVYRSNRKKYLKILSDEVYNGVNKLVKFY